MKPLCLTVGPVSRPRRCRWCRFLGPVRVPASALRCVAFACVAFFVAFAFLLRFWLGSVFLAFFAFFPPGPVLAPVEGVRSTQAKTPRLVRGNRILFFPTAQTRELAGCGDPGREGGRIRRRKRKRRWVIENERRERDGERERGGR